MQDKNGRKIKYNKPVVLAATKKNKSFSSGCMSGNATCLHCRKS